MSLKSALKADNTTIMGRTQGVKNGKISQYLQRATKVPLRGMGPVCSFLWWTQACPSGHGPPLSPATRPPVLSFRHQSIFNSDAAFLSFQRHKTCPLGDVFEIVVFHCAGEGAFGPYIKLNKVAGTSMSASRH